MITFPKIETLLCRDKETFKVYPEVRVSEFALINDWIVQEKIDGTNIRIDFRLNDDGAQKVTYGGRTDAAQIPANLYEVLVETAEPIKSVVFDEILPTYGIQSYTLFGEGYGAGIQKGGGDYREGRGFILFDVLINDRTWLPPAAVSDAATLLGLEAVPNLFIGSAEQVIKLCAYGFYSPIAKNPTKLAEGVVAKTILPLYDSKGNRLQWKLKTADFDREQFPLNPTDLSVFG